MNKYQPSEKLSEIFTQLVKEELLPWDEYYIRMAHTDFYSGRNKKAVKSFYIRKNPFGGDYTVLGGIQQVLTLWKNWPVDQNVTEALLELGYGRDFIKYLTESKQNSLKIYGMLDGNIFFPNQPYLIIEGEMVWVRLFEGFALKHLNFATLSLTKWTRCVRASGGRMIDFSRRRSQNSTISSIYALLAGCMGSSNSEVVRSFLGAKPIGTMGHEWVQSIGNEYEAFDIWLARNPKHATLLVDTIDVMGSGLPNAIKAFNKHKDSIFDANGFAAIRNDSGDLVDLTIREYLELKNAGLDWVKIVQTNDLDEYKIKEIKTGIFQKCIKHNISYSDVIDKVYWAAGTMPGTCYDQPSLGGVAKLSSVERDGKMRDVMKLAGNDIAKSSNPGFNFVYSEYINGYRVNDILVNKDSKKIVEYYDKRGYPGKIDIDKCLRRTIELDLDRDVLWIDVPKTIEYGISELNFDLNGDVLLHEFHIAKDIIEKKRAMSSKGSLIL